MAEPNADDRVVGADRVLAVLIALGEFPEGASLDEIAQAVGATKSTVHRALATLRRAGFAMQLARGMYVLGDDFFRLALRNYAARPGAALVQPALEALVGRFGETAHFAVLEGPDVVYRAKLDPPQGAIRLTSVVGGRNPAYCTAVGKVLLADSVATLDDLRKLVGETFEARTPNTVVSVAQLWDDIQQTRARGYGLDDQESERGINCLAVPVRLADDIPAFGAISVSAFAFRTPMEELVGRVDEIRSLVTAHRREPS